LLLNKVLNLKQRETNFSAKQIANYYRFIMHAINYLYTL